MGLCRRDFVLTDRAAARRFDVAALLKALHEAGFRGPVGFQGYGIGGNALENLRRTITAWKTLARYHVRRLGIPSGEKLHQPVRIAHENLAIHFRQEPSRRLYCHPGILGKRAGAIDESNAAGQVER